MQIFSFLSIGALLFGISASLDALILGITYGIQNLHISFRQNILISFLTLPGTCLCVWIGNRATPLLPASLGPLIGNAVLILFGLYYVLKALLSFQSNDRESSAQALSAKTAFLVGITLSANNMGIGLGASMAGLTLFPAAISTFLFSAFFLYLGNILGQHKLSHCLGNATEPLSGVLLILLGILGILI